MPRGGRGVGAGAGFQSIRMMPGRRKRGILCFWAPLSLHSDRPPRTHFYVTRRQSLVRS